MSPIPRCSPPPNIAIPHGANSSPYTPSGLPVLPEQGDCETPPLSPASIPLVPPTNISPLNTPPLNTLPIQPSASDSNTTDSQQVLLQCMQASVFGRKSYNTLRDSDGLYPPLPQKILPLMPTEFSLLKEQFQTSNFVYLSTVQTYALKTFNKVILADQRHNVSRKINACIIRCEREVSQDSLKTLKEAYSTSKPVEEIPENLRTYLQQLHDIRTTPQVRWGCAITQEDLATIQYQYKTQSLSVKDIQQFFRKNMYKHFPISSLQKRIRQLPHASCN